jgi:hypothetical protein
MNITAQQLMDLFQVDADAAEKAMEIIGKPTWGSNLGYDFEDLNDLLNTGGAEWIFTNEGDSASDSPGLWYLNTGDTYDTTLLGEVPEQNDNVQYSLGDWGSWEEEMAPKREVDLVRSALVSDYPQFDDLFDDDMWWDITSAYEDNGQKTENLVWYAYTQGLLDDFYVEGEISRVLDMDLSDKDEQEIIFEVSDYLSDKPQEREDFIATMFSGESLDDIQGIELTELMAEAGIDVQGVVDQRASDSQPFLSKDLEPKGQYSMRGRYR